MDQQQKQGSPSTISDQAMDMQFSDKIVFVEGTEHDQICQFLELLGSWGTAHQFAAINPSPCQQDILKSGFAKVSRWIKLENLQIDMMQLCTEEDNVQVPIEMSVYGQLRSSAFDNLSHLTLRSCLITNVEFLLTISIPTLTNLNLSKNQITSIKPLRKLNCPCLTEIDLSQNFILDIANFYEFHQLCFSILNIDNQMDSQSHTNVLGYLFKVQTKQLYISVSMNDIAYEYQSNALSQKFINQSWSVL